MAIQFYIPRNITVHLGDPDDSSAPNVTVPFQDYIKNVASSEIYPTWPESAIRANIYAQISFALNRIFTEHYRSQGYNFDITNTPRYDQAFVNGRDIFENISQIVDDIFNDYITREGSLNPLFAQYCSGTTVTCPGLSQWGTVELANQGYTPYEILQHYYGDNISLVFNAPLADGTESYPGTPLRLGDIGDGVRRIKAQLNVISRNYPAIPKIANLDALFDLETENAVKEFQRIFNLTQDGIVGKTTWYKISSIYNAVMRLAELDSQGIRLENVSKQFIDNLGTGDRGLGVEVIQYYLSLIREFNDYIPPVAIDGIYGPATAAAVEAFQQSEGIPVTGVVNEETWNALFSRYTSIVSALPPEYQNRGVQPYPGTFLRFGMSGDAVRTLQTYLQTISTAYPEIPSVTPTGYFGSETQNAVTAFQRLFDLPVRGVVGLQTWDRIAEIYTAVRDGGEKTFSQFPGYTIGQEG